MWPSNLRTVNNTRHCFWKLLHTSWCSKNTLEAFSVLLHKLAHPFHSCSNDHHLQHNSSLAYHAVVSKHMGNLLVTCSFYSNASFLPLEHRLGTRPTRPRPFARSAVPSKDGRMFEVDTTSDSRKDQEFQSRSHCFQKAGRTGNSAPNIHV